MFLQKNGSLRASRVFGPFDGRLSCYMFVTVRENAFGKDKVLDVLRSVTRKTESGGVLRETSLYVVPKLGS